MQKRQIQLLQKTGIKKRVLLKNLTLQVLQPCPKANQN